MSRPAARSSTRGRELERERLPEHRDRLLRAAVALTGSRHDAEDLVQETCVRVLRRRRRLHEADELAYLMAAMRNTWSSVRRSRRAEARAVQECAAVLERRPAADPFVSVEARALIAAVAELPAIHRDAIAAVDMLGLSCREAAGALRTPEGTVMSRLFRARAQVAETLG